MKLPCNDCRLELFRFHIHRLRCTSVFWAHFYSRLIQNFQILNTLTNGRIHGGYLNMTYVVEVPWFPLLLHKCILPFLKILEIWKFLHNLLLKSPTKMNVRLILRYMGPVYWTLWFKWNSLILILRVTLIFMNLHRHMKHWCSQSQVHLLQAQEPHDYNHLQRKHIVNCI